MLQYSNYFLQHHEKNIGERKKILGKLRHTAKKKGKDNADLDDQLEEMNVCVAERKHINDVNGEFRSKRSMCIYKA